VPSARPEAPAEAAPPAAGGLVVTSGTAVAAAIYAGLVATSILALMPALLAGAGVSDVAIGYVIGAFFLGRLVVQIPIGVIADRMDLRLLIAIIAGLTGVAVLLGTILVLTDVARIVAEAGLVNRVIFLLVMMLVGGLVLPLYTVANSLAFARAEGQPPVKIATTLLLVNSAGAVAGPLMVAAVMTVQQRYALPIVVIAASAAMCAFALWRRSVRAVHGRPATSLSDSPATSLALTGTVAEVKAERAAEAEVRAAAAA
jgi:MFS family permease